MAITFFSRTVGVVAAFRDPTLPSRYLIRMPGWQGFHGFKSIITNIQVASKGNYQFLHTLGGNIFIYVFGDRIGQLTVSGLAFEAICERDDRTSGIEQVFAYYNKNRIANRKLPMRITIGASTTIVAYLTGIAAGIEDPKTRIWSYRFQLAMIPDPNKKNLASKSGSGSAGGTAGTDPGTSGDPGAIAVINPPDKYAGIVETTEYPWPDRKTASSAAGWSADAGGWSSNPDFSIPVAAGSGYDDVGVGPNTSMTIASK